MNGGEKKGERGTGSVRAKVFGGAGPILER